MHSFTQHPHGVRSVFVVDRDDGVDLDRDEADERREAGLDGERGEGAEAEHGHQRIEYQTLREKKHRLRVCSGLRMIGPRWFNG